MNYYKKFCEKTGVQVREKDFYQMFQEQQVLESKHRMLVQKDESLSIGEAVYKLMVEWVLTAKDTAIELSWHDLACVMTFKSPAYLWCTYLGKAKLAGNQLSAIQEKAVKGLLNYSFRDINYDFSGLTEKEREIVGDEEIMNGIVEWITHNDKE